MQPKVKEMDQSHTACTWQSQESSPGKYLWDYYEAQSKEMNNQLDVGDKEEEPQKVVLNCSLPFSYCTKNTGALGSEGGQYYTYEGNLQPDIVMTSVRHPTWAGRNTCYTQAVNFQEPQTLRETCACLGTVITPVYLKEVSPLWKKQQGGCIKILPQMHWICRPCKRVLPLFEKLTNENDSGKLSEDTLHPWLEWLVFHILSTICIITLFIDLKS